IFTLEELSEIFDIKNISKSPAVFDIVKLKWMNAEYIKAMSPEAFAAVAEPFIRQAVKNPAIDAAKIASLLQQRTELLTDIPAKIDFFDELPEYGTDLYVHKKSKVNEDICLDMLGKIIPAFEAIENWCDETIHDVLMDLAAKEGVKNAVVMWPARIAAAGKSVTPGGAVEICSILGKEECLRRLAVGVEKLQNR
ncbi:MAG: glutamate--tRNA ligase, partial [Oscillospiraceae bacterium]|nr:glutamate--tRNA ligase [Oscillospiraceae bacterium]